ncbi:uncharacterized protein LOC133789412 [Humulus lupulus]|uniref:uncharacterized protein LOC133789412 n=1 Tax=Humulus lupulus TaxID=3486 RepID=UPI002B40F7B7|nr:uncharacterized protein LOC133789412 [Humulus lupulus]
MLLECGIGFRNEPSYGNYSPSFNESNLGEVKHDFINFELTFSPRKELFNEVPGNTDPNAFSCEPSNSENGKTMVEMDKDFNESLAKVRPPEKEKKEVEKGKEKDIVDEVTTHEPSIPGITVDHVVHEIEEDDNEKIDPPTLRREKELCKLDNLFQNMIHTYNESNYYQIGAFKLRRPLALASFEIALFIFDFSLSLTEVLVVNPMAKLERWYFRSLRPEAHVDMKIIDAFAHVLRFTHKEKCDKMEDMRTLILPTFHPNLESGHGRNFWEMGDFGFLGVPVDVTLVLNNAEKVFQAFLMQVIYFL